MPDLIRVALWMQPSGAYGRGVMRGVNQVASVRGWLLSIPFPDMVLPDQIKRWEPDGVIMDHALYREAPSELWRRTRVVALQPPLVGAIDGVPGVAPNDIATGAEAAQHFLQRGIRSFALFMMSNDGWARRRAEGFEGRLRQTLGRVPCPNWDIAHAPPRGPDADPADLHNITGWLRALPKPVGIFAGCDVWGTILIEWCRRAKLAVPEQIAIVGADNDELICECTLPPLSSVQIPWQRVGYEAARLMERALAGQPVRPAVTEIQPGGVVTRRSSDLVAVPDPDVAAALSFIQENAGRPISSADVLRHVVAGRNRLQAQFRTLVGRTMVAEIRRVHIERAKRLLVTTKLSVGQLAPHCGYPNATRLAEAFRKETGISPLEYRRRMVP